MKKILIVDDDAEFRSTVSGILKGAGYSAHEAASGREALEKVAAEDFDVALLDYMMPGISGIDVLVGMRRMKPKTKAIMITAFAMVENAVEAVKKGASDYISKPFRINDLLTIIRRVLEEASFSKGEKRMDMEYTLNSLANPIRRNIIQMLSLEPGARLMEITKKLDIEDHTKTIFHLKMLKETGIVEQSDKLYSLTKEGQRILDLLKVLEDYLSSN